MRLLLFSTAILLPTLSELVLKWLLSELQYKSAQNITQTLWVAVRHPEVEPWSNSELEPTLKLTCSVQKDWPDQKTREGKVQLSPLFLLPSRYTHMSTSLESTTRFYCCGWQCSFHVMLLPPLGQADANCCAPRAVSKQINPLSAAGQNCFLRIHDISLSTLLFKQAIASQIVIYLWKTKYFIEMMPKVQLLAGFAQN